jgi:DNA-binding transcriptional ArsR family regulator/uncharacterized protein YndB with AHSA1/START domain
MLDFLRGGPRTTGDLARQLPDLSRFAVMQHLGVLEKAGLVLFRREGRQRFNYANAIPLRQMYERWVEPLGSSAAATSLHLKRYAELEEARNSDREKQYEELSASQEKQMESSFRLVKIEQEMRIKAPREKVFAAITFNLNDWWPHRFKPDSEVYCEPKVGGTSGEKFTSGGGATYGEIVYIDPPHKLAQSGASALTKGMNAFGVDTLEEDGEGGTIYKKELNFWGVVPDDMVQMYEMGMRAIMEKALKGYVENGERYSPQGKEEFAG